MQKTFIKKPADVTREWHHVDAKGKVLGQVAVEIAKKLLGKHKIDYTPHVDGGDYVVVTNAAEVEVTGKKANNKMYYRHSGYPGGFKSQTFAELLAKFPDRVIELAVTNMLPKNKLRTLRMNRLKVYAGAEHKHESQLGK